ncbi:MAG TPA: efflux RND transporter periplasmic adaptor subunit [Verrucomicrobiales bacterium]|nr:efflux RND transporter periplasmic adaptor subunit [Verrucomicrobiales bacterium]HIL70284.1 efflux RND transporter periplasmic adaptor subunit [Verrucomicrobiota bacterium]
MYIRWRQQSLLVGCAVIGLAWMTLPSVCGEEAQEEKIIPVSIAPVTRSAVYQEVRLLGNVLARRFARLSSEVDGLVQKIMVEEGDYVKTGEVLCLIDSTLTELSLLESRSAVVRAEASLNEAERKHLNAVELSRQHVIADTELAALQADVQIQKAELNRLKAGYSRMEELLKRHRIRAPFNGVIVEKITEIGQWVRSGSEVFVLVEIDTVRVEFPVPQVYYNRINSLTDVHIQFDSISGENFQGAIQSRIPLGKRGTRTFPMRIDIENSKHRIAPGMSARVMLKLLEPNSDSLLVPRDAVAMDPDGNEWVVVIKNRRNALAGIRKTPVQTGKLFRDKIEILSGEVSEKDWLIVRGNEILEDDSQVRIMESLDL